MKLKLARSTTSKIVRVFIQDSTSTTGAGLAGLVYNSAGLTAYYIAEGSATATAITLATAVVGTYTSGGFVAVDATNMPGLYEIGIPNAALATGNSVLLYLKGATNMIPNLVEIELDAVNYQDGVRAGLTALPNVAQGNSGALSTGNATGQVTVAAYAAGQDPATLLLAAALSLNPTVGTVSEALSYARALAGGYKVENNTANTITVYAHDKTTALVTLTLAPSISAATSSTPNR